MGALIGIAAGALLLAVVFRGNAMTNTTDGRGTNTPGRNPRPGWQPPERAAPYLDIIRETEEAEGLPFNLLARVLYQESRYRPDIIDGRTVSSAGAQGIAQIVPRWHPNVDPLDPVAAIRYAGGYLRDLYSMFGNWEQALAAYNWGPGNLSKVKNDPNWLARAPLETRNYVTQIGGDVLA
ncbi:lytic transglycosylase domain-containing protein [Marinobacter alkaliphilus]|uniref:lytic transglycosylase domain-containing protein n=1 Tax=Marinobacter alkaliphilus TaxID=254719 RepID=UPI003D766AA1